MTFKPHVRRPPSLVFRLSLLFGMVAFVVFSVFGWFIDDSIQHHFAEEDESELKAVAEAVEKVLLTDLSRDDLSSLNRRFHDILIGHHGALLYITDQSGKTFYNSVGPELSKRIMANANTDADGIHHWTDGERIFRVLIRNLRDAKFSTEPDYNIAVVVPIDYHLRFLDGFRYTLWLMIASAIVITSLMGWIAIRKGHAPLHHIVAQIHQISANQLNTRLSPDSVPRELTNLAVSFNEMLARMEEAFLRLSNFSADIAHELRTPVTSLMTQTQVSLSQMRTTDEYREILYSNIEEYERMAQMIGDMLFLAQADNGLSMPNNAEVDLAQEIHTLFDYYEAWAEESQVVLMLEGNATVTGDRLMLRRALNNLLTNAIRHTLAGGTVQVRLSHTIQDGVRIEIENPGEEIAPQHLKKLFDRFYRVDPSRQSNGAGLGLAIVKSIIDAHGGEIEVISADGITQFRIIL